MLQKLFLLFCFFFLRTLAFAQVTLLLEKIPANTPENANIYVSGNFEGWSGGKEAYKVSKNQNGTYSITLPQQTGKLEFKFTRGSWETVEKAASGAEIANRTYTFGGNGETVRFEVAAWSDLLGGNSAKPSTAAANVGIVSESFEMPELGRKRKIRLYLPPNYASSNLRYPVLYMHDGQNLFDNATSFSGEWQVDESLNTYFEKTGKGIIVVGIDNGGSYRIPEYTPWRHPNYGGGEGAKYMQFVVKTLKPYIDKQYRTLADKPNTALMGSSLGGLISHFGALEYPQVFGKIGVFSPSFWFSDSTYILASQKANIQDTKMFLLAGGAESATMVAEMEKMLQTMKQAGFKPENMSSKVVPAGTHSEGFWRNEFPFAIQYLFGEIPKTPDSEIITHIQSHENDLKINIFPNPTQEEVSINVEQKGRNLLLEVFDSQGKKVLEKNFSETYQVAMSGLRKGNYTFKISDQKAVIFSKVLKW